MAKSISPFGRGIRNRLVATYYHLRWAPYKLPSITYLDVTGNATIDAIRNPEMRDICMPPYVGDPTFRDFDALIGIAMKLQPRLVIELGTAYGNTVANLCRFVADLHVVTVNAPAREQSGALTTFELTADEIGRVYRSCGCSDRVTQVLANTLTMDLSGYVADASCGLAIIDACHDTEYVLNDFHKIRSFSSEGGYILFHDTHPSMRGHLRGSYMACMRLRKQGFDVRHLVGTSWGIWRHGAFGPD